MPDNVWVLAEHWRGKLSEITFEALALGRDLAAGLGRELDAVLLGHEVKALAGELGAADRVLCCEHPLLAELTPDIYAEALAQLARQRAPAVVIAPLTNVTLGVGTLLASKLEAPAINFCRDARVVEGKIEALAVMYGGKIECRVTAARAPAILGLWPGSRPAEAGRKSAPPAAIEDAPVTLAAPARVRLKEYIEPEMGEIDISAEQVLVAVGRGIQSQDNIELAEELAAALGGAVCGSRPVIDQGWLALSRQVGKSGATVKPKLYLAAGISGAPEHVEGIRASELVIAINSDPQAPIFNVAHYGAVADALDLLPALTQAVRGRKG